MQEERRTGRLHALAEQGHGQRRSHRKLPPKNFQLRMLPPYIQIPLSLKGVQPGKGRGKGRERQTTTNRRKGGIPSREAHLCPLRRRLGRRKKERKERIEHYNVHPMRVRYWLRHSVNDDLTQVPCVKACDVRAQQRISAYWTSAYSLSSLRAKTGSQTVGLPHRERSFKHV